MNPDTGVIRPITDEAPLQPGEIELTAEEAADLMQRRLDERVARLEELRSRIGSTNAAKRRSRKASR